MKSLRSWNISAQWPNNAVPNDHFSGHLSWLDLEENRKPFIINIIEPNEFIQRTKIASRFCPLMTKLGRTATSLHPMQRQLLRTPVVENPGPDASVKWLYLFEDHLNLGDEQIPFNQIMARRVQNGCLCFWQGERIVRLSVHGFVSKGSEDPYLPRMLNDIIDALVIGEEQRAHAIIATFRIKGRGFGVYCAVLAAYLLAIGSVFAIFSELLVQTAWSLLLFAAAVVTAPFVSMFILSALCRISGLIGRTLNYRGR